MKRDGRLTGVAVDEAVAALEDSRDRLLRRRPALIAAAERAHAATLPLARSGAVMSRVAGLMLRSDSGTNRLLRTMLAAAERT